MFCRADLGRSTSEGVRIYLILHLILNPQLWHAGIPTLGTGYAWPLTSTIKGHLGHRDVTLAADSPTAVKLTFI